jgi:hypothetical protein
MKLFLTAVLFSFFNLSQVFAQTIPEQFLNMESEEQIEFLYSQEVEEHIDSDAIESLMTAEIQALLKKGAESMLSVWWDTILEGPYGISEEKPYTQIESVFTVQNKVYAIQAYVSNKAYFIETDGCEMLEDSYIWNENCTEGEIYEMFYMDFQGNIIESDEYAEFSS